MVDSSICRDAKPIQHCASDITSEAISEILSNECQREKRLKVMIVYVGPCLRTIFFLVLFFLGIY